MKIDNCYYLVMNGGIGYFLNYFLSYLFSFYPACSLQFILQWCA